MRNASSLEMIAELMAAAVGVKGIWTLGCAALGAVMVRLSDANEKETVNAADQARNSRVA
jgi:hypothetical protein